MLTAAQKGWRNKKATIGGLRISASIVSGATTNFYTHVAFEEYETDFFFGSVNISY